MQSFPKLILLIIAIGFFRVGNTAPADLHWNGSTNNNMNTAANWTPAQIPNVNGENDTLTFPASSPLSVTNNIPGTLLIGNIFIESNHMISGNAFGINSPSHGYLGNFTLTFSSNNADIDVPVNLNGTWFITSTATGNAINGIITGSTHGNLNLANGRLTLGASNNYSGVLTVGNELSLMGKPPAYLQAGANNAFGNIGFDTVVTVSSRATLDLNNFSTGIGSLTGPTGSKIQLGTGTLTVNKGSAQTPFYGVISGTGNVIVNANELALIGNNTYSGTTTVKGGGHLVSLDTNLGNTSSVIFGPGGGGVLIPGNASPSKKNYTFNDSGTIGVPSGAHPLTLNGTFSGNASFIKNGPGTLLFKGTNSNTGNIHLWGGVLNLESLGSATGFTFDSPAKGLGTLQVGSSSISTIPLSFKFNNPGIIDTNGHDITINGAISGEHYLVKTGNGKLTLPFPGNNIKAKTKIHEGILNITHDGYHTATQTVFAGSGTGTGTLQIDESFTISNDKSFDMPIVFMADGTIDTQTFHMDIKNVIAGLPTYTFNKVGSGTLTLIGANIYQGPTHVKEGTLKAGIATESSGAFGVGSAVTVDTGATLDFSTYANTVDSLDNSGTVNSSATIKADTFTQAGTGTIILDFPTSAISPAGEVQTSGVITLDGTLNVKNSGGFIPGQGTELVLFESTGSGKRLKGTFASTSIHPNLGSIHYDHSENKVYLGASSTGCDGTWENTSDGTWATAGNWVSCVPGLSGVTADQDTATFGNLHSAPHNVTVTLANSEGNAPQTVTLHDLEFNSSVISYSINQYMGGGKIVLDSAPSSSKPKITIFSGNHKIDAPITIEKDARFSLHSESNLTLGLNAVITSTSGAWNLSEGSGNGILTNHGNITPSSILIEGNTVNNEGTIYPSGALAISGLGGTNGVTVNNNMTLTAGSIFTLGNSSGDSTLNNNAGTVSSIGAFTMGGSTGIATLTNKGMVKSDSTMTINSGTITNHPDGKIVSNDTLKINGGIITNHSGGVLGSSLADLVLSGGTLETSDEVLAKKYTQSGGVLTLDFPTASPTLYGNILASDIITVANELHILNTGKGLPTSPSHIVLLRTSDTTASQLIKGSFSSVTLPSGISGTIKYDRKGGEILLVQGTCHAIWAQTASSSPWTIPANWDPPCAPGVEKTGEDNNTATFQDIAGAPSQITVTLLGAGTPIVLDQLVFDAANTEFTIENSSGTGIELDRPNASTSPPMITLNQGQATINAPIKLNKDARFSLSNGTLTLGEDATITSDPGVLLEISEGHTSGTLTNRGMITPSSLLIEGSTVNNYGHILPSSTIEIKDLSGIDSPIVVNNFSEMVAGTSFTLSGNSLISNHKNMVATDDFTIESGQVINESGGHLSAGDGKTFTVNGGMIINRHGGSLGSSHADLILTKGTIHTAGQVLAHQYTQHPAATLELDLSHLPHYGPVAIDGQANFAGSLIINGCVDCPLSSFQNLDLITAKGGIPDLSRFSTVSFQNFSNSLIVDIKYLEDVVKLYAKPVVPSHFSGHPQIILSGIKQHGSIIRRKCFQIKDRTLKKPCSAQEEKIPLSHSLSERGVLEKVSNTTDTLYTFHDTSSQESIENAQSLALHTYHQSNQTGIDFNPVKIYAGPIGSFGHLSTNHDQIGQKYCSAGGMLGADYLFADGKNTPVDIGVGGLIFYRKQWGDGEKNAGSFHSDLLQGSLYTAFLPKLMPDASIEASMSVAYVWDHLNRTSGFDDQDIARSNTKEKIFDMFLGIEYRFHPSTNLLLVPLIYLQYTGNHIDGYKESGAGIYNLMTKSASVHSLSSIFGGRIRYTYPASSYSLSFEFDAEWIREYLNQDRPVGFTPFTITSQPTTVKGLAAPKTSILLGLDITAEWKDGWELEASCTTQFNHIFYDVLFQLGVKKHF
ncbi:autotransporter domain-containing protein [Candidatus Neptunichlamydia sp. REUL1]|uniref:autotransporter domain-containing protein n=1 Tax=Candidatus Neptunichlamydia sp. REUL1 TaxID=3064277 RepID=UPI00292DE83B|nr:autotransporter domain-containing protein [Candidatus Neptunochlamydia sp. REUL1]